MSTTAIPSLLHVLLDGELHEYDISKAGLMAVADAIVSELNLTRPVELGCYQIGNVDIRVEPVGGDRLRVILTDCPAPEDADTWQRNCPEVGDGLCEEMEPRMVPEMALFGARREVVQLALNMHIQSVRCYGGVA